jgi:hypothetical protein
MEVKHIYMNWCTYSLLLCNRMHSPIIKRRIVGRIVFCVIRVVSKESKGLALPRTSCFDSCCNILGVQRSLQLLHWQVELCRVMQTAEKHTAPWYASSYMFRSTTLLPLQLCRVPSSSWRHSSTVPHSSSSGYRLQNGRSESNLPRAWETEQAGGGVQAIQLL